MNSRVYSVTVLPGDGIGPEMIEHVKRLCKTAQVPVDFENIQLDSHQSINTWNEDLENAIISIERNGVALKGNIETKFNDPTVKSRNVQLRYDIIFSPNGFCAQFFCMQTKFYATFCFGIFQNAELGLMKAWETCWKSRVFKSLKKWNRYDVLQHEIFLLFGII